MAAQIHSSGRPRWVKIIWATKFLKSLVCQAIKNSGAWQYYLQHQIVTSAFKQTLNRHIAKDVSSWTLTAEIICGLNRFKEICNCKHQRINSFGEWIFQLTRILFKPLARGASKTNHISSSLSSCSDIKKDTKIHCGFVCQCPGTYAETLI